MNSNLNVMDIIKTNLEARGGKKDNYIVHEQVYEFVELVNTNQNFDGLINTAAAVYTPSYTSTS